MKRLFMLIILGWSVVTINANTEIEVGSVAQIKGKDIVIKYKNATDPLKMNQLLHIVSIGNKPIVLKGIYPMQTSAKCVIISGDISLIKQSDLVYEGNKIETDNSIKSKLLDMYNVKINPVNKHKYFLSMNGTWQETEDEAALLGGHLVTIRNKDEEKWITETFGKTAPYWIGLRPEGLFKILKWSSGEDSVYGNWKDGQPYNKTNCGVVIHMNQDLALEVYHDWGTFD